MSRLLQTSANSLVIAVIETGLGVSFSNDLTRSSLSFSVQSGTQRKQKALQSRQGGVFIFQPSNPRSNKILHLSFSLETQTQDIKLAKNFFTEKISDGHFITCFNSTFFNFLFLPDTAVERHLNARCTFPPKHLQLPDGKHDGLFF